MKKLIILISIIVSFNVSANNINNIYFDSYNEYSMACQSELDKYCEGDPRYIKRLLMGSWSCNIRCYSEDIFNKNMIKILEKRLEKQIENERNKNRLEYLKKENKKALKFYK